MLKFQVLLCLFTLIISGTFRAKIGIALTIIQVFLLGFENGFIGDLSWTAFFEGKFTNSEIAACLLPAGLWSGFIGFALGIIAIPENIAIRSNSENQCLKHTNPTGKD